MKTRWLDRRIAKAGPYLALCLSEREFKACMSHLKSPVVPQWCNSDATTHVFEHEGGKLCCVVCLRNIETHNAIEIAGLLVHEAVHVWQHYCDDIGEDRPGLEQEAYGIQSIAQELMAEFARRKAGRRTGALG